MFFLPTQRLNQFRKSIDLSLTVVCCQLSKACGGKSKYIFLYSNTVYTDYYKTIGTAYNLVCWVSSSNNYVDFTKSQNPSGIILHFDNSPEK